MAEVRLTAISQDKFMDPRNTHVELEGFDGDWEVR